MSLPTWCIKISPSYPTVMVSVSVLYLRGNRTSLLCDNRLDGVDRRKNTAPTKGQYRETDAHRKVANCTIIGNKSTGAINHQTVYKKRGGGRRKIAAPKNENVCPALQSHRSLANFSSPFPFFFFFFSFIST